MVAAMVPYSLELIDPSADSAEHRRRLREMGAVGRVTAWCLPRWLDGAAPRRVWGALYFTTWAVIVIIGVTVTLFATTPGQSVGKNLAIVLCMAGGWFAVHAAIVAFARAINRANRRDAQNGTALEQEDEGSEVAEGPAEADDIDTPATSTAQAPRSRFSNALGFIGMLLFVVILRITADHLPFLSAAHAFTVRHALPARAIVFGLAGAGLVMFMAALFMLMLGNDGGGGSRAMSHEQVEALQAQTSYPGGAYSPALARGAKYRIRGETMGRTGHDEWSFGEMKAAWRSGAWRTDPMWRRRYLVTCGALLMTLGVFGIPAVLGPPWVMLLSSVVLVYAFVRTTWAFYRA